MNFALTLLTFLWLFNTALKMRLCTRRNQQE